MCSVIQSPIACSSIHFVAVLVGPHGPQVDLDLLSINTCLLKWSLYYIIIDIVLHYSSGACVEYMYHTV